MRQGPSYDHAGGVARKVSNYARQLGSAVRTMTLTNTYSSIVECYSFSHAEWLPVQPFVSHS